jgi:hypothetical protein
VRLFLASKIMSNPASVDEARIALRKALPGPVPGLQRIPRNPGYRDVVLGILALSLQRRYPYTEPELRDVLEEALVEFNGSVDHVTCRRYMVDLGFVKRDRAGMRYFVNYPRVESALSKEVIDTHHDLIAAALLANTKKPGRPRKEA